MILERHADSSTQLTYVKPPTGRQIVNSNEESNVGFNVLMLIHIFVQFTLVRVSSPREPVAARQVIDRDFIGVALPSRAGDRNSVRQKLVREELCDDLHR